MKEKSLFQLKRFWFFVVIPILISVWVGIYIYQYSEIQLQGGYKGVNDLLVVFKVPLGIAAIVFPLVALVAASHRSEQTKKQILISHQQNTFSNYYKHVEEFGKLSEKLEEKYNIKNKGALANYRHFFGKNTPSYFSPYYDEAKANENIYVAHAELDTALKKFKKSIKENRYQPSELAESLNDFYESLAKVSMLINFEPNFQDESFFFVVPKPLMQGTRIYYSQNDPFFHLRVFVRYVNDLRFFLLLESVSYTLIFNKEVEDAFKNIYLPIYCNET